MEYLMKLRGVLACMLALAVSSGASLAQTSQGSSPLSGRKGGTNNSFMQFTGPATSIKTFTLPNVSDTIVLLTQAQTLTNKTLTAPVMTTPQLGAALGTSLALNGCTIGSHALCATGTALIGAGVTIATASANSLTVGNTAPTNPVFHVDSSTASQAAGLKVTGAATGGTVAIAAIDSGSNANISINGKGSGTIAIGNVSTGAVTITPTTTHSNAITYGGVTLSNSVTGTGSMVLSTSPALTTPNLGTPSAAILTNATGLPLSGHTSQAANTIVANATGSSAAPTAVSIPALTQKASPVANDKIMIADSASSDALKYATVSSISAAGSVASIAGNTGAFTLGGGITNSANDIRLANNGAVLAGGPAAPSGLTSATQQMFGLGVTTCRITPVYSTRLRFTILGRSFNTSSGNSSFNIRYGTGSGPANGATASSSGTGIIPNSVTMTLNPNSSVFNFYGTAQGLTPGVAVWFDLAGSATVGTTNVADLQCSAEEF
jgi:hypothetical protein